MSNIHVATNFNIDIEFTAPPFYRRLFSWVIDIVVLVFYIIVASSFLEWFNRQLDNNEGNNVTRWAVSLLVMLPFMLYHLVLEVTLRHPLFPSIPVDQRFGRMESER